MISFFGPLSSKACKWQRLRALVASVKIPEATLSLRSGEQLSRRRKKLAQGLPRDVSSGEIEYDFAPAQSVFDLERRCQGGCSCRLDEIVRRFHHEEDSLADLLIADQDEVAQILAQKDQGQFEADARGEPFGESVHEVGRDDSPLSPGEVGGRSGLGLDSDDFDLGIERARGQGDARSPAAPAHGHQDDFDIGQILDDLQADGSHAGDQMRLVRRMDVAISLALGQLLDVLARFVEVSPVDEDLGTQPLDGLHLIGIAADGHGDARPHAEEPRRPGDGLPVIPCRSRDDAATAFLRAQARDEIHPSAHFERPDRLVILMLDVHFRFEQLAQTRIGVEGGPRQIGANQCARLQHIQKRRYRVHPSSLLLRDMDMGLCHRGGVRAKG